MKYAIGDNIIGKHMISTIDNQISKIHPLEYHFDDPNFYRFIRECNIDIELLKNKTYVEYVNVTNDNGKIKYMLS